MTRRRKVGLLAAAVAVVLTMPTAALADDPSGRVDDAAVVLADVLLDESGPQLRSQVGDRSIDPGDLEVTIDGERALTVLPEDLPDQYLFLGRAGDELYQVPGARQEGLPALGLRSPAAWPDGAADLTVRHRGPGDITAFVTDARDDDVETIVDTADEPVAEISLESGGPTYPTWTFSEPGEYEIDVTPTVRTQGGVLTGPTVTYDIEVTDPSPEPDTAERDDAQGDAAIEPDAIERPTIVGLEPAYRDGESVELQARTADDTRGDLRWQVRRQSDPSFQTVQDNTSDLLTFPAERDLDGTRIRAQVIDADGDVAATSAEARVVVRAQDVGATATTVIEPCFGVEEIAEDVETVTSGHLDFGPEVVSGSSLRSRLKDDRAAEPMWRSPESVLFRMEDEASALQVPDNPQFSFLGDPQETVWLMPQTQNPQVPWLGWNTQHPSALEHIDGDTTMTLEGVDGPGELYIFQSGSFGQLTKVLGEEADWPKTTTITRNQHVHASWAFTEPGVYRITLGHSATLDNGSTETSEATVTFVVGPCDFLPAGALLDDELVDGNTGGLEVNPTTVTPGDSVTIDLPEAVEAAEGDQFMPVFYSEPQQAGWSVADADGSLASVTVPDLAEGDHKVAVYTADGELVGWAPIAVEAASDDDDDQPGGGGDGPGGGDDPAGGADDGSGGGGDAARDGSDADQSSGTPGVSGVGGPIGGGTVAGQPCLPGEGSSSADGSGAAEGSAGSGGAGTASENVSDGHLDFGAHIVDRDLVPKIKDDRSSPPQWVDPASRTLVVGSKAEMEVPEGGDYSFLGSPGATVWMISQTQVSGVPWLGWNTQHETVRSEVRGDVNFRLDSVEGPGELAVFMNGSFGGVGEKKMGSVSGFPTSFNVAKNVHAHGNWAFTEPGTYDVTITQTATLNSGEEVSAPGTVRFVVGGGGATAEGASASAASPLSSMLQTVAIPSADSEEESTEEGAEESASDEDSDEESAAIPSAGDDCVLPKTGAPDLAGAIALALTFLALGAAVLVRQGSSRRRVTGRA